MRLLIGTHFFETHRGGIEIVAGQLARCFVRAGIEVTWLAADATPSPGARDGCGTARPLRATNIIERRFGLPFPLPLLGALACIWQEVGRSQAVMLHDSLYPTNIALRVAAWFHRRPVILVQHIGAVPYQSRALNLLMRLANRLVTQTMLRSAEQVVFISRTTQTYFADLPFRRAPVLIPNGVDAATFRPVAGPQEKGRQRRELGLPETGPILLFVGRFVEKKGFRVLEALAHARPDLQFAFAGWGPLDPERWRLPNVWVYRDRQGASLVALYQACDLFVLPSCGEGLPLVLQEALACGLPTLCGADTATADANLTRWVTGVPVDPADAASTAAAFAAAIEHSLAQPPDLSWRDACAAACHAHYAWPQAAASYHAILDLICKPGASEATALSRGR
jgi:glycosyltransferase involved in cell wall biosynthesis